MRRKWKARVISGILSAAMVVSMTPGAVLGAGYDTTADGSQEETEKKLDIRDIIGKDLETFSFEEELSLPDVDLSGKEAALPDEEDEDALPQDGETEDALPQDAGNADSGPGLATIAAVPGARAAADERVSRPAGEGTEEAPYQITGPEELRWFAGLVNGTLQDAEQNTAACAVLQNDISFQEDLDAKIPWTPIGYGYDADGSRISYTGTFDGASYVIDSLYISTDEVDATVGLFGVNRGTVKDISVTGALVECGDIAACDPDGGETVDSAGVIAGTNRGDITGCTIVSADISAPRDAGGIAGYNYSGGRISGSAVLAVSVVSAEYAGGIAAYNSGELSDNVSYANVTGEYTVGGITGTNEGSIEHNIFMGTVMANPYEMDSVVDSYTGERCGGIAGYNREDGVITGCETGYDSSEALELAPELDPEQNEDLNVLLQDAASSGVAYVGGITGRNYGAVDGCHNHLRVMALPFDLSEIPEGDTTEYASSYYIGGIVGRNRVDTHSDGSASVGTITGCSNYGQVGGEKDDGLFAPTPAENEIIVEIGGIAGSNYGAVIEGCNNYGSICGRLDVGGIAGRCYSKISGDTVLPGQIKNCSTETDITQRSRIAGNENVGGIAGYTGDPYTQIENCQNIGMIIARGDDSAGGIVGFNEGHVLNCINGDPDAGFMEALLNQVMGEEVVGGIAGANVYQGVLEGCSNYGSISSFDSFLGDEEDTDVFAINEAYAGGIAGVNSASIINCSSAGEEADIDARTCAGGIAGGNFGTVEGCTVGDQVTVYGEKYAGGIVGVNSDSPEDFGLEELADPDYTNYIPETWPALVKDCGSDCIVQARNEDAAEGTAAKNRYRGIGGVAGQNEGTLTGCRFGGEIQSEETTEDSVGFGIGGGAGVNDGQITGLYVSCWIQTDSATAAGGAAGYNTGAISSSKVICYISASGFAGGIVGQNSFSGTIDQCEFMQGRVMLSENTSDGSESDTTGVYAGGIVGYNLGDVTDCDSISGSVSALAMAGGVAGYNTGSIKDSSSSLEVIASQGVGGIAGVNDYRIVMAGAVGEITGCVNAGAVIGQMSENWYLESIGGIAGENYGRIVDCVNDGPVDGTLQDVEDVGGIVGYASMDEDISGVISGCENHGAVKGASDVGGVIGALESGTVEKSCSDGDVTAVIAAGGVAGYVSCGGPASIVSCYNQGTIQCTRGYAGGIAGSVTVYDIEDASGLKVADCYNVGRIRTDSHLEDAEKTGGILGIVLDDGRKDAVSVTNSYYLDGCVEGTGVYGLADEESGACAMKASEFLNGHVAWMLQNKEPDGALVWGQKLIYSYDMFDLFPVLADVEEERVVMVTLLADVSQTEDGEVIYDGYANTGTLLDEDVAAGAEKEGYTLDGWYRDPQLTEKWDLSTDAVGSTDMVLYARWIPDARLLYGDVDENGTVNVADALAVLKSVVGSLKLSDQQQKLADVDGKGGVQVTDALLILKKVVGSIDAFPVDKQ